MVMHQNAPLPDRKSKHFLGRGHNPFSRPLPTREGDTPSPGTTPLGAFGTSVHPFLFIYDSNTDCNNNVAQHSLLREEIANERT